MIGIAAARVAAELAERLLQLIHADAERTQGGGVGGDPELSYLPADGDDLRDARNGQQSGPQHEVGGLAHLHGRHAIRRRQGDQHDLAHDGIDRAHLGRDIGGQLIAHQGQTLGDLLAVAKDLRAPVEFDIDDRQSDA